MKVKSLVGWLPLFVFLSLLLIGCSSGGSNGTERAVATASLETDPSSHDFGVVTVNNFPAPLEVKIKNNGSSNLTVTEISLLDEDNFDLFLGGGSNPCSISSPTIAAGDFCSVEVTFQPMVVGAYDAVLEIHSNAGNSSENEVLLSGIYEPVDVLNVRINQVETGYCPEITTYVSVTDQGGFSVTGLSQSEFQVLEDDTPMNISGFSFAPHVLPPISIALAMDYSGSVTAFAEDVQDAEEAISNFVYQIRNEDEAEIIKFGTEVEVVQPFTSDKNLLQNAIVSPADHLHWNTKLYDAAWQAVEDTAARLKVRKAVIILSDGEDVQLDGGQASTRTLSEVIELANNNGVPIFTIALGNFNKNVLRQMAEDTGGLFFDVPTAENLKTSYQQLASVLIDNQYILGYETAAAAGTAVNLTIEATTGGKTGSQSKVITPCRN